MRTTGFDTHWLARAATDPNRSGRRLLVVLVTLSLGGSLFGLGHDHFEGGLADNDHCVVCHAQQSILLGDPIVETASLIIPRGNAFLPDLAPTWSVSSRYAQPRRGPPTS